MNKKYTFLLPAYKAHFFADALQSIKNQSYLDFNVIVSDDCSPEDLKSIFDREVGDDPRFTYRRNKENMGGESLVSHWNLLVDMCDTEYLIMASDDDVYAPNYLEEIDALTRTFSEIDVLRGRMAKMDGEGVVFREDDPAPELLNVLEYLQRKYTTAIQAGLQNFTFKTDVLKSYGGFINFPLAWFSDDATVLECSGNGICITPDVVFKMRISGQNITCQRERNIIDKKLIATMQFGDWVFPFLNSIEDYSDTKYASMSDDAWNGVKHHIQKMAMELYEYASVPVAISLYCWLIKYKLLPSRSQYLKSYIRARLLA